MNERPQREEHAPRQETPPQPQGPPTEPIVLSATEARQGEIILGKYGRWIWIGSFAVIALLVLVLGFWP